MNFTRSMNSWRRGTKKKIFLTPYSLGPFLGRRKERERERKRKRGGEREREKETRQGGLTDMHTNYAIKKDPITLEEPQCII